MPYFWWLRLILSYNISKNPLRGFIWVQKILNFTCLTMKFYNCHHVNAYVPLEILNHLQEPSEYSYNTMSIVFVHLICFESYYTIINSFIMRPKLRKLVGHTVLNVSRQQGHHESQGSKRDFNPQNFYH